MAEGSHPIWREPVRGALPDRSYYSLSGLEQIRALFRGYIPRSPLARLTGLGMTQVASASTTLTMPASPWLQFPDGTIDIHILLDRALHTAIATSAPPATAVNIAVLSVNQLRPVTTESTTLIARARALSSGRTFTYAEAQMEDAHGRTVAHGRASATMSPMDPPPPPPPLELTTVEDPVYATPDPTDRPLPAELAPVRAAIEGEIEGMKWLRSITSGDFPVPVASLIGLSIVDGDEGSCTLVFPATEWLCAGGTQGHVTPGVLASALSYAMSASVITLSPGGRRLGNLDHSVTFLRPVVPDGREILVRSKLIHAGPLFASTAEAIDAEGNRVALGYQTSVLVEVRRYAASAAPERVLATVLFTDIVGSTERATEGGDAKWRQTLEEHHGIVRRQLRQFKGHEVKTTGDGFLATFDSPARAVQCARAIRDDLRRVGIDIRSGLHLGECEVMGADIGGIAVHVASRVKSAAMGGEILVSGSIRDAVAGSGLRFADHGLHTLRGLDEEWHLYAVVD